MKRRWELFKLGFVISFLRAKAAARRRIADRWEAAYMAGDPRAKAIYAGVSREVIKLEAAAGVLEEEAGYWQGLAPMLGPRMEDGGLHKHSGDHRGA